MHTEGKPWEEALNGNLNLTSWAAVATFGIVELAVDELTAAEIPMNKTNVSALSQTFASIVGDVQESLTGTTSWQDGANSRLRGALRCAIRSMPVPFGGDAATWRSWVASVTRRTGAIASTAIDLWSREPSTDAWKALAVDDDDDDPFLDED